MGQQRSRIAAPQPPFQAAHDQVSVFAAGQETEFTASGLLQPPVEFQVVLMPGPRDRDPRPGLQEGVEEFGFQPAHLHGQVDRGAPQPGEPADQPAQPPRVFAALAGMVLGQVGPHPGGRVAFSGAQLVGDAGGLQEEHPVIGFDVAG